MTKKIELIIFVMICVVLYCSKSSYKDVEINKNSEYSIADSIYIMPDSVIQPEWDYIEIFTEKSFRKSVIKKLNKRLPGQVIKFHLPAIIGNDGYEIIGMDIDKFINIVEGCNCRLIKYIEDMNLGIFRIMYKKKDKLDAD